MAAKSGLLYQRVSSIYYYKLFLERKCSTDKQHDYESNNYLLFKQAEQRLQMYSVMEQMKGSDKNARDTIEDAAMNAAIFLLKVSYPNKKMGQSSRGQFNRPRKKWIKLTKSNVSLFQSVQ